MVSIRYMKSSNDDQSVALAQIFQVWLLEVRILKPIAAA